MQIPAKKHRQRKIKMETGTIKKLRVLIAEDHQIVRAGIKLLIDSQADMEVIAEAENGEIAVTKTIQFLPDIVLMDVSMPKMNGLRATKKIRQNCPQVKILTLTRHSDDGYLQQLISAGANGYVLKQSAPEELIRAVRSVADGGGYLDSTIVNKVMGGYVNRHAKLRGENKAEITERESEILRQIAWGYSNKEIGTRMDISVKTVEAHKSNAMRKLGFRSRIDIVRFAILQGWLEDN